MAERNMERWGWYAKILGEHDIYNWVHDRDGSLKHPEATFIVVWDGKEQRHLVIVDLGFDENGRVSHKDVLEKFKRLGFSNFEVIGGGVLGRSVTIEPTVCYIKHYNSDTIGNIPRRYWSDIRKTLNVDAILHE